MTIELYVPPPVPEPRRPKPVDTAVKTVATTMAVFFGVEAFRALTGSKR